MSCACQNFKPLSASSDSALAGQAFARGAKGKLAVRRFQVAGFNALAVGSDAGELRDLRRVAAISIAADSVVEAIDLWLDGDMLDPSKRRRVSVKRPLLGPFDCDRAIAVPVTSHADPSGISASVLLPSKLAASQFGVATIELHDELTPSVYAGERAPDSWQFDYTAASGVQGALDLPVWPTSGRSLVSVFVKCSVAAPLILRGYHAYSNGTDKGATAFAQQTIYTGTAALAHFIEYSGAPYTMMDLVVSGSEGDPESDISVVVKTYDGYK